MKHVIHCADTPDEREVTAAEVHQWHKQRGWDGIGYHYFIRRDGTIEHGRPKYWTGSHVKGHNTGSIGTCLAGRDHFTDEQYTSLRILLDRHKAEFGEILGHCELDPQKACPGTEIMNFLNAYRTQNLG